MRILLSLLFVLTLCTCGRAQKTTLPELRQQLQSVGDNDAERLDAYHKLFQKSLLDSAAATGLLDTIKTLSRRINTPKSAGLFELRSAYYQSRYGDIEEAKAAAHRALPLLKEANAPLEIAKTYRQLGYFAYTQRDYEATYRFAESELEAAREANDDAAIGSAYSNIAIGNRRTGNLAGAIAYDRLALSHLEQAGDSSTLISLLINLGGTYNAPNNFKADSAIYFMERARNIATVYGEQDPRRIGKIYGAMARVHARDKDLNQALEKAQKSLVLLREGGVISDIYEVTFYLGSLNQRTGNYPKAKEFLYEAARLVPREEGIDPTWLYYSLGEYYRGLQQADSTAHYYQKYAEAIGAAQSQRRTKVVAELEAKFQSKEKQAKIDRLALKDQVKSLQLKRQSWLIGGGLLLLGLLGSFLYFSLQQRRRIRKQNETISEALAEKDTLLKEIHHRVKNNLQMVSSLLSLQSDYVEDDAALDALQMGQRRVRSMAIIHQKLYMRDEVSTNISARDYLDQLIGELMQTLNVNGASLKLTKKLEDIDLDIDRLIPLGLIANEVITNAMKYAFQHRDSGQLDIDFRRQGSEVELVITDDGPGLGQEFSERTDSFGSLLIRTFAEQLEGTIAVDDQAGTRVQLRFPFEAEQV